MTFTFEDLKALRSEGYTDDQIASVLQEEDPSIGDVFKEGFTLEQITSTISGQPIPEAAPQEFFSFEDAVSAIGTIPEALAVGVPAAFQKLVTGLEIPEKSEAIESEIAFQERMQQEQADREASGKATVFGSAVRAGAPSFAGSLTTMPAAIVGGIAGAAAGGPAAPITGPAGAMAASGTVAYRMAGSDLMYRAYKQLEEKKGSPLTDEEKAEYYKTILPIAQNAALWEAGPEAISNAVTVGVGKFVFGFGKGAAKEVVDKSIEAANKTLTRKIAEKGAAVAGGLGAEIGTEAVTAVGQFPQQAKVEQFVETGTTEGAETQYPGGYLQAVKDVAPATTAVYFGMGAVGGGAKLATLPFQRQKSPEQIAEDNINLEADRLSRELSIGETDEETRGIAAALTTARDNLTAKKEVYTALEPTAPAAQSLGLEIRQMERDVAMLDTELRKRTGEPIAQAEKKQAELAAKLAAPPTEKAPLVSSTITAATPTIGEKQPTSPMIGAEPTQPAPAEGLPTDTSATILNYDERVKPIQDRIDAKIDELMADGMTFEEADSSPEVAALYEERFAMDRGAINSYRDIVNQAFADQGITQNDLTTTPARAIIEDVYAAPREGSEGLISVIAERGQQAFDNDAATIKKLAEAIFKHRAEAEGLSPEGLLGPQSALTKEGKKARVDEARVAAEAIHNQIKNALVTPAPETAAATAVVPEREGAPAERTATLEEIEKEDPVLAKKIKAQRKKEFEGSLKTQQEINARSFQAVTPEGTPFNIQGTKFVTERGSQYTFDGQKSQRYKAQREMEREAGEQYGLKEPSDVTYFVSPEGATEIGMWQTLKAPGKRILVEGNQLVLLSFNQFTNKWGSNGRIPIVSNTPQVGLSPIELFAKDNQGMYLGNHPGNKIVSISGKEAKVQSLGNRMLNAINEQTGNVEDLNTNDGPVLVKGKGARRMAAEGRAEKVAPVPKANRYTIKSAIIETNKLFGGEVPPNFAIITDPTNKEFEFKAAYDPNNGMVILNLAYIRNTDNLQDIISHELGHYLYGDPEFQSAFEGFWNAMTPEQQALGDEIIQSLYNKNSGQIQTEEKQVRAFMSLIEEANAQPQWRRVLDAIKRWFNRVFGTEFQTTDRGALDVLAAGVKRFGSGEQIIRAEVTERRMAAQTQNARFAELEARARAGDKEAEAEAQRMVDEKRKEYIYATVNLPVSKGFEKFPATRIRFGEIPTNEAGEQIASVGFDGGIQEDGISVASGFLDPDTGIYILETGSGQSLASISEIAGQERNAYIVEGDVLDTVGDDGEALLQPGSVRIIREIPLSKIVTDDDPSLAIDGSDLDIEPTWEGKGLPRQSDDVFTYDDAGNLIPLSERFQPATPDIRRMAAEPRREEGPVQESPEGQSVPKAMSKGIDIGPENNMPPNRKIDSHLKNFLFLRGFFESASDRLRRNGFTRLGNAIDGYFDQARARIGMAQKILLNPFQEYEASKDKKRIEDDVQKFFAAQENKRDTAPVRSEMHPTAIKIVDAWQKFGEESGKDNQRVGVKVFEPKKGTWRKIGRVEKFWPRQLKPEYQRALFEPDKYQKEYNEIVEALIEDGKIQKPEEAERYLREYRPEAYRNDYFSGIEMARGMPLPEKLYDYSMQVMTGYVARWAQHTSRIEAFGQKTTEDSKTMWDREMESTRNPMTKDYIQAARDRVEGFFPNDPFLRGASALNIWATGLQLGNPASAMLNWLGGTTLNAMIGQPGAAKSFVDSLIELRNLGAQMQDAREKGIISRDLMNIVGDHQAILESNKVAMAGQKVADFLLKWSGFTPVEQMVRTQSFIIGKSFIRSALNANLENPKGSYARRSRAWLTRNNFDLDKLIVEEGSGPETDRVLRYFANISQGSYTVDQVPLFIDMPIGRFLFKYQKFSTQVMRASWKNTFEPAWKAVTGRDETVQLPNQARQILYRLKLAEAKELGDTRPITLDAIPKKVGKAEARALTLIPAMMWLASAYVGGEVLLRMRDMLFGVLMKGPEYEDMLKELEDDENAAALYMGLERAWYNLIGIGALGLIGNYAQFFLDWSDRERVKNPLDPPALSIIKENVQFIGNVYDQGAITAGDLDDYAKRQISAYRTTQKLAQSTAGWLGMEEIPGVKQEMFRREVASINKYARRWAEEAGIEYRMRRPGDVAATERTPINRKIAGFLQSGESEKAAVFAREYLDGLPKDERKNAIQSITTGARNRQPLRLGSGPMDETERRAFLRWLKENVNEEKYEKILEMDRQYQRDYRRFLGMVPNR